MRNIVPSLRTMLIPNMHALPIIIWDWDLIVMGSINFKRHPYNIDVSSHIALPICSMRGIQLAITPPSIMAGGTSSIGLELLSRERGMRPMVTGRTFHVCKSTLNVGRGSLPRVGPRALLIAMVERNPIYDARSISPMSQQILQVIHFHCNLVSL